MYFWSDFSFFQKICYFCIKFYHIMADQETITNLSELGEFALIDKLVKNAKLTDGITSTLTHILEGLSTDCSVCSLKDVCDEVEGMKELHFGRAAAGEQHD